MTSRMVQRARPYLLRLTGRRAIVAITLLVLSYLVLAPLAFLILSSFKETVGTLPFEEAAPWTFSNYVEVFFSSTTYRVLASTASFAIGSLIVALAIGASLAWLVERTDIPLRTLLYVLIIAPAGIPLFILAIGWSLLLNPTSGAFNEAIRALTGSAGPGPLNAYTIPAMIVIQGMAMVPITFLLLAGSFRGMNALYDDASSTSGAGLATTLRRITIPLVTPALLATLVYQFVTSLETIDIPLVLGLRGGITVLSTHTFLFADPPSGLPNYGLASTYGILLLVLAIGPLLLYNRAIRRGSSYVSVGGRGYRARTLALGALRYPAFALVIGFVVVSYLLPLLMLFWTSTQPFYAGFTEDALGRFTLEGYPATLSQPTVGSAMINTLIVGLSAALGAMTIAFFVSWIVVRSRSPLGGLVDLLAFMPHAFPGVVIGLSILLLYLFVPIPIYGTVWIIAIALGTQYISLATRVTSGGLVRIHGSLEEAATMSGASQLQALLRVTLPLMLPSFLNGFLLVLISSVQNLTLPLLLFGPGSNVMSAVIFTRWDNGDVIGASVLGVVMAASTAAASLLLRRASMLEERLHG